MIDLFFFFLCDYGYRAQATVACALHQSTIKQAIVQPLEFTPDGGLKISCSDGGWYFLSPMQAQDKKLVQLLLIQAKGGGSDKNVQFPLPFPIRISGDPTFQNTRPAPLRGRTNIFCPT